MVLSLSLVLCSSVLAKDGSGKLKFTERTLNTFLSYLGGEGVTNQGDWFKSGEPTVFAVSPSGKHAFYYYCPKKYLASGGCTPVGTVIGKAQNACKKNAKNAGSSERCFIFAKKRKIVWDSINYTFPKKLSTEFVKNKLKELGFYGQQALKKEEKIEKKKVEKKKETKKNYTVIVKNKKDKLAFTKRVKPSKEDAIAEALKGCRVYFESQGKEMQDACYIDSINGKKYTATEDTNQTDDSSDIVQQIKNLKELYDDGVLTKEEFEKAKKKLLN